MAEKPTDEEVTTAFRKYLSERADSGVAIAKHASDITLDEGTVVITLAEEHEGVTLNALLDVSPFENLAQFPGTVIAFKNEEGNRLRERVQAVSVRRENGDELGTMSSAELYKRGTGEDLS